MSPAVGVTVKNAGPSVSITAPADGATLGGIVTLEASGGTDPNTSDVPTQVEFQVSGEEVGGFGCDGVSKTCSGSTRWDTRQVVGKQTIEAVLSTYGGQTATDTIHVTVKSGTTITFKTVSAVAGESVTIRGHAASNIDQSPAAALPVTVSITPVLGGAQTHQVTTTSTGAFSVTTTLLSKAKVKASTPGNAEFQRASASTTAQIAPAAQCSLAKRRVRSGRHDSLVCTAPHLPDGATATLLTKSNGVWSDSQLHGKASSGRLRIGFDVTGTGKLKMRMYFFTNRVYGAGYGPVVTVTIT